MQTHIHRQRGQSLVEFCVVVPTFLFLLLVIFQLVLIYRAKTTLDYATFQAARAGAVNGADAGAMRRALAGGLAPLMATSPDAGGVIEARLRAETEVINPLFTRLEVISPTRGAWDTYKERQYNGRFALPNDSLAFRPDNVAGAQVNVQDANILKIKVTYQFPLIVPFVDRILAGLSDYVTEGPSYTPPLMAVPVGRHRRMPMVSSASVRMQSPVFDRANLAN